MTVPHAGAIGSVPLFVICFLVIISMYGGGFATVPAYLKDMFGTRYVGAIHGMLLTAWSAAGIFGPVLVNYISAYQVAHNVSKADSYNLPMYIMAGLARHWLLLQSRDQGSRQAASYGGRKRS